MKNAAMTPGSSEFHPYPEKAMSSRKPDTPDRSLAERQGLDDRELKENRDANNKARQEARQNWEHAASRNKDKKTISDNGD